MAVGVAKGTTVGGGGVAARVGVSTIVGADAGVGVSATAVIDVATDVPASAPSPDFDSHPAPTAG